MAQRKILGTNKFVIYMYNGKLVRGKTIAKPEHFIYRQYGRIFEVSEDGKRETAGKAFTNYGELIDYINKKMTKITRKNLKSNN